MIMRVWTVRGRCMELSKLRREVQRVRMERNILKLAAAYFAKESN